MKPRILPIFVVFLILSSAFAKKKKKKEKSELKTDCFDAAPKERCERWYANNDCSEQPQKMLVNCRQTCNFCRCRDYVFPISVCKKKKEEGKCNEKNIAASCWRTCSTCGISSENLPGAPAVMPKPKTTTTTAPTFPQTTTTTTTSAPPTTTTTTTKKRTTTTTTTTKPATTTTTTTTKPPTTTTTTTLPPAVVEQTSKKESYECGIPMFRNVGKVVGGEEVVKGSFPWQVSLRRSTTKRHFCGGSLVTSDWVVTAGHCVAWSDSPSDFGVFLGKHYRRENSRRDSNQIWSLVAQVIIHEDYNVDYLYNDIALMRLTKPVELSDYIIPICLPSSDKVLHPNEDLVVTGWGDTKSTVDNDRVLRMATVPYVKTSQCQNWLGTIRPTEFCAGREGKDSCQGDSGGPLQKIDGDGRTELVGIVSWGIGCALKNKPGVYTRVSEYVTWINQNMRKSRIYQGGFRGGRQGIVNDLPDGDVPLPNGEVIKIKRDNE